MKCMISPHAEDVLRILRERGILATDEDEPNVVTTGTINTVIRARTTEGIVYVRIGPPQEVTMTPSWLRPDALENEAIVLDRVKAVVDVPVPVAAGFDPRRPIWLIQKEIEGEPFADAEAEMAVLDRLDLWRNVGRVLRRIHEVRGQWFGTPNGADRYPDWPSMVRADARGLLRDAERLGLPLDNYHAPLELIDTHEGELQHVTRPALVHSDLDARHVFVERGDGEWRVTGIIDWEYARYVDPWSESLLVELLAQPDDGPVRQAVLEGYGVDANVLSDPSFWIRQEIYRGIARGWGETDAARLEMS